MLENNIINNYVFQNPYKEYFCDNLFLIKSIIDFNVKRECFKSVSFSISGFFNSKERIIDFPNFFTYSYSVLKILNINKKDFGKLKSKYNSMIIDFNNRKFKSNSYSKSLENRINLLLNEYDYMYKIDIKNFYKSVYTHVFDKLKNNSNMIDSYIRLFNNDKTNSLLLGNLLSTLSANEIMDDLCTKIHNQIPDANIEYFSDQFYIFFNENIDKKYIIDSVKKIIGSDYFEFEINDNDTILYTHENLIKFRNFRKQIDSLCDIQNIKRHDEEFFVYKNVEYSNGKLEHFFNSVIDAYYNIDINKRKTFIEVTFKRVFCSPFNLFRLGLVLDDDDDVSERIIEILFMFLNKHSELILLYIKSGLWYIIENSKIYNKKTLFYKYSEKFYYKMISRIESINSVYDFHIYYLLKNKFVNPKDYQSLIIDYESNIKDKNLFLASIITSTFNLKLKRNQILNLKFNDESWLYNYTSYLNSRFYQYQNDIISKTAFLAKKAKIHILKRLDEIDVSSAIVDKIKQCRFEFEKK